MKLLLFAFTFVVLAKATSAQPDESLKITSLTDSQLFMKASCEALAEFATPDSPAPLEPQWASVSEEVPLSSEYIVESVSLVDWAPQKMVFRLSFAFADDKRATIQSIVEYNCFQCLNRIHETFVFTTENDPEVACKED